MKMQVFVVEVQEEVEIGGVSIIETDLMHIASSLDNAKEYMVSHKNSACEGNNWNFALSTYWVDADCDNADNDPELLGHFYPDDL
jgi:hypothetical protein